MNDDKSGCETGRSYQRRQPPTRVTRAPPAASRASSSRYSRGSRLCAGEYVSVSSQVDTEAAERQLERFELAAFPVSERRELAAIYRKRGLDAELAEQVATQLMAHDALGAHLRAELGLSEETAARPVQAALASAASFGCGAALPLTTVLLAPRALLSVVVFAVSNAGLALLGGIGAQLGGAPIFRGVVRVVFWGALAMMVTIGISHLIGAAI